MLSIVNTVFNECLKEAERTANNEWLLLLGCTIIVLAIVIFINYYQFSKSIWIADVKGKVKKKRTLEILRHVIAGLLFIGALVFLVAVRIYKEPLQLHRNFEGYNVRYDEMTDEEREMYPEYVDIKIDFVITRRVFDKKREITGSVVIDDIEYIAYYGFNYFYGDGKDFRMGFAGREYDGGKIDMQLHVTDGFENFWFYDMTDAFGGSAFRVTAD